MRAMPLSGTVSLNCLIKPLGLQLFVCRQGEVRWGEDEGGLSARMAASGKHSG